MSLDVSLQLNQQFIALARLAQILQLSLLQADLIVPDRCIYQVIHALLELLLQAEQLLIGDHGPLERLQLGLHLLPLIINSQVNLLKCGLRLESGFFQP